MNDTNAHKPGYKHTPLGWVPEEWEVNELGVIADKSRPISYGIVQTGEPVENGVKCVRVVDINEGIINAKDLITTTEEISKSYKRTILKQSDIVIALRGKIGALAIIGKELEGANLTRGVALIAPQAQYSPDFIFQQLSSPMYKGILEKNLNGSALQELSIGVLRKILLLIPKSLPEQNKIATILSTWDTAIAKTQEIIRQLQERNRGLMQELLTGKKRIPGFVNPWRTFKLEELTEKISRRNKKRINASVYSVTNSNGFVLQSEHFSREVAGEDLTQYKVVKKGEFAYNPARINVGSIAYFQHDIGIISSLYVCFKTNVQLDDTFLLYFLKLDHTKYKIESYGEGGVRIYLWYELFSKILIQLPDLDEQNAISSLLCRADEEIRIYEQKLQGLIQQKKGLMQKLLTGAIRVFPNLSPS